MLVVIANADKQGGALIDRRAARDKRMAWVESIEHFNPSRFHDESESVRYSGVGTRHSTEKR